MASEAHIILLKLHHWSMESSIFVIFDISHIPNIYDIFFQFFVGSESGKTNGHEYMYLHEKRALPGLSQY